MDQDSNDTIYDEFLYKVDEAIEQGNANLLRQIIILYSNKISQQYIDMAKKMYEELVIESFEDMTI